jgi:hypothetical protein
MTGSAANDEPVIGFLHPGDEVSRIGNCIMIKCHDEDNAIVIMELFKDIAHGKHVTIGPADESESND